MSTYLNMKRFSVIVALSVATVVAATLFERDITTFNFCSTDFVDELELEAAAPQISSSAAELPVPLTVTVGCGGGLTCQATPISTAVLSVVPTQDVPPLQSLINQLPSGAVDTFGVR